MNFTCIVTRKVTYICSSDMSVTIGIDCWYIEIIESDSVNIMGCEHYVSICQLSALNCSLFTFIPIEWLPIQHTKKHLWVTYDKMCVKRTWLILNDYTYIKYYPNSSQISSWLPSCLVLKFCDVTAKNVNKSHVGHLGWLIWKISHFSLDINWKHNSRIFIFACMALE